MIQKYSLNEQHELQLKTIIFESKNLKTRPKHEYLQKLQGIQKVSTIDDCPGQICSESSLFSHNSWIISLNVFWEKWKSY